MGSDWIWELRVPAAAEPALRELYALAADRDLRPQRPDGLTGLWLDVAERLNADAGRVLDEWSCEQVWDLGIHDASHPAGGWPAELGWWTYLGPDRHLPPAPLPEIAAQARRLPNGALLVKLLDDPAAVDPLRYQDIHTRWLRAA